MAEKDTQWKQKYYDSLDGIERQEKEWKALEDLFKQAISRLSLAAEGNSKSLDSDLNQLRAAIRKGQDNRTIRSILENVSKEIIKLDKQAKSGPGGDAGFLLKIIEQMRLAGTTEKKSRSLLKQLKGKNPPEQNELLKSFTELLSEVIKQAVLESKTNNGHNKTGGGFLKNLFSGGKEPSAGIEPLAENPEVSQDSSTPQALVKETGEHQDDTLNQVQLTSVVATVQNVLEAIIDGLDISEEVKEQLKNTVFKVKPSKEIHVLLDDLKDILDGSGIVGQHRSDSRANENPDGIAEHQDLLISLIEFLPLDESVKEQGEQLKDSFSHGISTEQLPQALKSIADLISMMHTNVQQEQKEFEVFLKNLTGRLKEVDQYLQSNFQEHQQSYQSGVDLDNAVKDQVREIGDSVALINKLDEVESAVQTHLDQIVAHIDLHRTQEDERVARIEAQNNELSEQLKQLESESGQLRRQVVDSQNRALVDPLTQLPNRLAYDQRLKQEYARWKRYNSTLLIMVWDIDFFKQVNDTYGHQAGDKVLKVVASLLNKNLRETDFISRFGGEEFVSLMPETTLGGGYKVAEKIRESVEKLEFHYRGNIVKVTISCGISLFMENDTVEKTFSRADKALYQAKEQGRNRCVIAKEPSA